MNQSIDKKNLEQEILTNEELVQQNKMLKMQVGNLEVQISQLREALESKTQQN